jgi:cell division septation protein DedD
MKYSNGLVISTVALAFLATGCVKKTDNVTPSGTYGTTQSVYNTPQATQSTTYETASPIIYDNSAGGTTSASGTSYSGVPTDTTYQQPTTTYTYDQQPTTTYTYDQQPPASSYPPVTTQPAPASSNTYSSDYGADNYTTTGGSTTYSDPYAGQTYSSNETSYTPSASTGGGGISLQIAALKDYYAAQEFKNNLSLDPKYQVYIKRGSLNKVIITGISSVSEANRLKERRFPGAFIVHGSSTGSSSSYSSSSSASTYGSYSGGGYTDNNDYGSSSSSSSSYSGSGGIGIQIGAFSKQSTAQSMANANSGQYRAIVKKVRTQGRTLYKVILTGFSSRSAAKRALNSGSVANGFVVSY